jgi:hypothetical protein
MSAQQQTDTNQLRARTNEGGTNGCECEQVGQDQSEHHQRNHHPGARTRPGEHEQRVGKREQALEGNERGAANMNKDPGAQEGYKRALGTIQMSVSRYKESAGVMDECGGDERAQGVQTRGGSGASSGGYTPLIPCLPPSLPSFSFFII